MWISAEFEIRAYPETRPSCPAENERVFMAALPLKVSGGNNCRLTEPDSNPNWSRKVSENSILSLVTTFMCALDPMG